MKKWNGSQWVSLAPKKWNGSQWTSITEKKATSTGWGSSSSGSTSSGNTGGNTGGSTSSGNTGGSTSSGNTSGGSTGSSTSGGTGGGNKVVNVKSSWSGVYNKNDKKRTDLGTRMQQGQYSGDTQQGINKSLVGFSLGDYKGKNITGIRLYLRTTDFYYTSGGTIHIGWHKHGSVPSTFSHDKYSGVTQKYTARVQEKWIVMPKAFVDGVKAGTIKGISIFYNSAEWHGYARLHAHGSDYPPKLEITYFND